MLTCSIKNMLTCRCINDKRDDESFMRVKRVSWGALLQKYELVENPH
jgi:hypothetical protein